MGRVAAHKDAVILGKGAATCLGGRPGAFGGRGRPPPSGPSRSLRRRPDADPTMGSRSGPRGSREHHRPRPR
jgi:hypothetical protein